MNDYPVEKMTKAETGLTSCAKPIKMGYTIQFVNSVFMFYALYTCAKYKLILQKFTHHTIVTSIIALSFIISGTSIFPQTVSQNRFNYKGFSMIINDDAMDENYNHLLVGEIRATETQEDKRDTTINRIFKLKGYCDDHSMGIIIATDKNHKLLQIIPSFPGKKVIYDQNKKQFTIGANFLDYLHEDDRYFSAWQPVIIQLDLRLRGKQFFIQKPYSCILDNIAIENDEIIVFTRSFLDQKNNFEKNGKADVIRVTTSKFHNDSTRPWLQVLDPISSTETYTNVGSIVLSNISKVDSAYYFTTSNLNQSSLKNINHLYQLKKNKLTILHYFSDYLKTDNLGSNWIMINEFMASSTKNYLFLTHLGATNKEITFSKTDENFNTVLSKKIPINDYADFNKMLVLSNGNIVILMANNQETWSYFLYNSNIELIKEINSTISKDYYPTNIKALDNERIECFFYIDNVNKNDCVLQTINFNE